MSSHCCSCRFNTSEYGCEYGTGDPTRTGAGRFPCSFLLRPTGINDSLGSWILDLVSKYVTTSLKTDHRPKREGGVRFTVESQREQETHKVDERGKLTRYFRRAPYSITLHVPLNPSN